MKLVFLDTETTGLPEDFAAGELGPEITEYAIADWEDGVTSNVVHKYVYPGNPREVTPGGFKLSFEPGLWDSRRAIRWNASDCRMMQERLGNGALLAGSNPAFDMARIAEECQRSSRPVPDWSHRKLDLNSLGYPLWAEGKIEKTSLVVLASYFGIEHDAHTSLGDMLASIKVWEALYDLYCFRPRVMREALVEIADQAATDADTQLEEYARNASEGIEA